MKNLKPIQREFLKTITNVERFKLLKKEFQKVNKEIEGLTEDQIYSLNNAVVSESSKKKLLKIFREENLLFNFNGSIN